MNDRIWTISHHYNRNIRKTIKIQFFGEFVVVSVVNGVINLPKLIQHQKPKKKIVNRTMNGIAKSTIKSIHNIIFILSVIECIGGSQFDRQMSMCKSYVIYVVVVIVVVCRQSEIVITEIYNYLRAEWVFKYRVGISYFSKAHTSIIL